MTPEHVQLLADVRFNVGVVIGFSMGIVVWALVSALSLRMFPWFGDSK